MTDSSTAPASHSVDHLILGGGLAGTSMAFWLHRYFPGQSRLILEKNHLGFGASGRNAGFLTSGSLIHFQKLVDRWGVDSALKIWRFSEENLNLLLKHIIEGYRQELGFRQLGSLTCCLEPAVAAWIENAAMTADRAGINILEVVDPPSPLKAFAKAYLYPHDGAVHPMNLVKAIARAAHTKVVENCDVRDVRKTNAGWIVETASQSYLCGRVYLCGNGYSHQMFPPLTGLIDPIRGQMLETKPVNNVVLGPNVYVSDRLIYFRQTPEGRFRLGGLRSLDTPREVGTEDFLNPVIQQGLDEFRETHWDVSTEVESRWSGVMGFTKNELPLIGALPGHPGLFLLAGFSGHGMGLAFHSAKLLVESFSGSTIPEFFAVPN